MTQDRLPVIPVLPPTEAAKRLKQIMEKEVRTHLAAMFRPPTFKPEERKIP